MVRFNGRERHRHDLHIPNLWAAQRSVYLIRPNVLYPWSCPLGYLGGQQIGLMLGAAHSVGLRGAIYLVVGAS
jgi:hypothetical protein